MNKLGKNLTEALDISTENISICFVHLKALTIFEKLMFD